MSDFLRCFAQHLHRSHRALEIAFPAPVILGQRVMAMLPKRPQLALGKRMARSSSTEKGAL
jgi:hypothetical protein